MCTSTVLLDRVPTSQTRLIHWQKPLRRSKKIVQILVDQKFPLLYTACVVSDNQLRS